MNAPVAKKRYDTESGKYVIDESREKQVQPVKKDDEPDVFVKNTSIPNTGQREIDHLHNSPEWKYSEDEILSDVREYLASTYGEHYKTDTKDIECFDAWIALGDSTPTFRNTALKYLWRYGNKDGNNKKDLLKALHYIMLMLHVDHYKEYRK